MEMASYFSPMKHFSFFMTWVIYFPLSNIKHYIANILIRNIHICIFKYITLINI